jgi:hypothetical protein
MTRPKKPPISVVGPLPIHGVVRIRNLDDEMQKVMLETNGTTTETKLRWATTYSPVTDIAYSSYFLEHPNDSTVWLAFARAWDQTIAEGMGATLGEAWKDLTNKLIAIEERK